MPYVRDLLAIADILIPLTRGDNLMPYAPGLVQQLIPLERAAVARVAWITDDGILEPHPLIVPEVGMAWRADVHGDEVEAAGWRMSTAASHRGGAIGR